jgi:uncharacterized protein (DUF924 family)
MGAHASVIERVFDFYVGRPGEDGLVLRREEWFKTDADFDTAIRDGFMTDHEAAAAGDLDALMGTVEGCLALVILLDQFPRNMFRGTARAFASDAKALAVACHAIDQGWDRDRDPVERMFLYLPFEHSESVADQERCCALFADLGDENWNNYAAHHLEIIARFGRFPHRNETLERDSTDDEKAFLEEPGSSF